MITHPYQQNRTTSQHFIITVNVIAAETQIASSQTSKQRSSFFGGWGTMWINDLFMHDSQASAHDLLTGSTGAMEYTEGMNILIIQSLSVTSARQKE